MTSLQGYVGAAAAASSSELSTAHDAGVVGGDVSDLAASAPVMRPRGYSDAHLAVKRCGPASGTLGDPAFYAAAAVSLLTVVLVACATGWINLGAAEHAAATASVSGIEAAPSRAAEVNTAEIETSATLPPVTENELGAAPSEASAEPDAEQQVAVETAEYLPPAFRAKAIDPRVARPPSPDDPIERAPPEAAPRPPVRWAAASADAESDADAAPWRRHAQPPPAAAEIEDAPILAIVIDDLGFDLGQVKRLLSLPAPITLAILPYAPNAEASAKLARQAGRELLVHVPMEPVGGEDPGPNALTVGLSVEENVKRLDANLAIFSGYVGVNNHMGSAVTANAEIMRGVLEELNSRGLMYLDSRTANNSWGWRLAERMNMPAAVNHVFLDNVRKTSEVRRWLRVAARQARERGAAVAIGHPHAATLEALEAWLEADGPGDVTLVPISTVAARLLAERQNEEAPEAEPAGEGEPAEAEAEATPASTGRP